jgi:O-antigen ligase
VTQTLNSWTKEDLYYFLFLLFIFLIPVSSFLSIRVLVLILFLSPFLRKGLHNLINRAWDIFAYFGVIVVGLIYTEDMPAGLRVLETSFSLLCMPFIFAPLKKFGDADVHKALLAFSVGIVSASLICLGHAGVAFYQTSDPTAFYFYNLTDFLGFQPTYFAYYLILALTHSLYCLFYMRGSVSPLVNAIISAFLFLILMLTGGHTAFVAFLLIAAFFFFRFFTGTISRYSISALSMVVVMVTFMFIVSVREKVDRSEILDDGWDRYVLWESALRATPDIFGVGTGDYRNEIQDYYLAHDLPQFAGETFNAHNQVIQLLFSNGILGVAAFLVLLLRPLYVVYKRESVLGILTLFPFVIYSVTEVFLGRYQGVVIFATLHQVWLNHHYSERVGAAKGW